MAWGFAGDAVGNELAGGWAYEAAGMAAGGENEAASAPENRLPPTDEYREPPAAAAGSAPAGSAAAGSAMRASAIRAAGGSMTAGLAAPAAGAEKFE